MRQRSKTEQTRADIAQAYRSQVRLKYSIAAAHEINEVLPLLLGQFDKAMMRGLPFEVDIQELVEDAALSDEV